MMRKETGKQHMNGIINLKKEAGMTSHDAVFKLRKILGTKKIGHGGTLDPDVVGVLPIAVGKATRMVEFMQDEGDFSLVKSFRLISSNPKQIKCIFIGHPKTVGYTS